MQGTKSEKKRRRRGKKAAGGEEEGGAEGGEEEGNTAQGPVEVVKEIVAEDGTVMTIKEVIPGTQAEGEEEEDEEEEEDDDGMWLPVYYVRINNVYRVHCRMSVSLMRCCLRASNSTMM